MKRYLAVIVMSMLLYMGYTYCNAAFSSETMYRNTEIVVHNGDTMWAIASRWSDEREDVREVIYRICQENKLSNTELLPGQRLIVPVRVQYEKGLMMAEAGNNG